MSGQRIDDRVELAFHHQIQLMQGQPDAMIGQPSLAAMSLILPLSICFSKDYATLRSRIFSMGLGLSVSNYDNIPDCLFKFGKPESSNMNPVTKQKTSVILFESASQQI